MKIKKHLKAIIGKKVMMMSALAILGSFGLASLGTNEMAYAAKECGVDSPTTSKVDTKLDLGCNGANANPIIDLTFALIRLLSAGVGIFAIISVIYAGIRYTTAGGNPEQVSEAKNRIQNTIIGLILYIFIFALVQYLVPGGIFN